MWIKSLSHFLYGYIHLCLMGSIIITSNSRYAWLESNLDECSKEISETRRQTHTCSHHFLILHTWVVNCVLQDMKPLCMNKHWCPVLSNVSFEYYYKSNYHWTAALLQSQSFCSHSLPGCIAFSFIYSLFSSSLLDYTLCQ